MDAVIEVDRPLNQTRAPWYCQQLEEGKVLLLPATALLDAADQTFLLGVHQAGAAYHKNISFRPADGRVKGYAKHGVASTRLREVLARYSQAAADLAARLLAPYARHWRLDLASYRPIEEAGRRLSLHARNDLLHVDAFPTRPTNGARLLRLFTNINPTQSRLWRVGEPFERVAPRLARTAGLDLVARRTRSRSIRLRRLLVQLGRALGLRVRHRSPYDEFMLKFHDYLKRDAQFQDSAQTAHLEFPPESTWVVFTDIVPHAVLSGQYALEQTFIVPVEALLLPDKAPLAVLERLAGVPLTA